MPEIWETTDLMEVSYSDDAAPPDGFWRDRFFSRPFYSEAQEIMFDDLPNRDRRLAPFVAPNVQGRVMRSRGSSMTSFKPAYVKPKHVVDPSKAIPRMRGEQLSSLLAGGGGGSPMTLDERFDAHVSANVVTERELIERRIDWMACQSAVYGGVTIVGEDYPEVYVDWKRDASMTLTPGAGLTWDDEDSRPLQDLQQIRVNGFNLSRSPLRNVIMDPDAWAAFSVHETTQKLLDKMKGGSESNFNTTGLTDGNPVEYMGYVSGPDGAGRMDLWTYSNEYEDEEGNMHRYMGSGHVCVIGGNLGGVTAFGAIMDKRAGLQALPIFPKSWESEDPSAVYTMSQSAPITVPTNPNNSGLIKSLG